MKKLIMICLLSGGLLAISCGAQARCWNQVVVQQGPNRTIRTNRWICGPGPFYRPGWRRVWVRRGWGPGPWWGWGPRTHFTFVFR